MEKWKFYSKSIRHIVLDKASISSNLVWSFSELYFFRIAFKTMLIFSHAILSSSLILLNPMACAASFFSLNTACVSLSSLFRMRSFAINRRVRIWVRLNTFLETYQSVIPSPTVVTERMQEKLSKQKKFEIRNKKA